MCDPASEEECVVGARDRLRRKGQISEIVAGVIDRHEDHDEATNDVDGFETRGTSDGNNAGSFRHGGRLQGLGGVRLRHRFLRCPPTASYLAAPPRYAPPSRFSSRWEGASSLCRRRGCRGRQLRQLFLCLRTGECAGGIVHVERQDLLVILDGLGLVARFIVSLRQ